MSALSPMRSMAAEGSGGFCLFELPDDGSGKRKYINLTIVQFVEVGKDELKIVYGGGALGSGYEAKVSLKSPEEGRTILERIRKTASECR
jgi:hypothetical protein